VSEADRRTAPKSALVTGGASGIGRATVELMLERGWQVVAADLNEQSGEQMLAELGAGESLDFIRTDVSQEGQVRAAVDRVRTRFGAIGCVVNNAGLGGAFGPLTEIEVEDWDFTFAVLVRGPFLGIKHGARAMREQGTGGSIVNTGSTAALAAGLGPQAYSAAKSALLGLTRVAAAELARDRIRVNTVNPGMIKTPLTSQTHAQGTALGEAFRKACPWPDEGSPRDVAAVIAFLAGEDSGFVTGESLTVDGGMIAAGPMAGLADPAGGPTSVVGVNRGTTGAESTVRRRLQG
jgi:NAD(P)-dependent dehydrogenase (short-subunit alcohol dehydrogenase family)